MKNSITTVTCLILLLSNQIVFADSKNKTYTFSGQTMHSIDISSAKKIIKKEPSSFNSGKEYTDYFKNSFDSREDTWVYIALTNPSDLIETKPNELVKHCHIEALALAFSTSTIQLHPKKLACELSTNEIKNYAIENQAPDFSMVFSAKTTEASRFFENNQHNKYITDLPQDVKRTYLKQIKNEPSVLTLPANTKVKGKFSYMERTS